MGSKISLSIKMMLEVSALFYQFLICYFSNQKNKKNNVRHHKELAFNTSQSHVQSVDSDTLQMATFDIACK